jgi:hypothetical protein
MKVICNRGALLDALTVTGNVVASRTPKPVLQCVKITAADDRLTLAATDLEVAIRYSDSQVQVEQGGEALLPADKLRDIVRESMDDTLSIEVGADTGAGGGSGGGGGAGCRAASAAISGVTACTKPVGSQRRYSPQLQKSRSSGFSLPQL